MCANSEGSGAHMISIIMVAYVISTIMVGYVILRTKAPLLFAA